MASIPSDGLVAVALAASADPSRLTAIVLDAVMSALPELAADPAVAELVRATVTGTVTIGLTVIGSGTGLDEVHAPPAGLQLARRLAQQNVPLPLMLRAYRLGQAAFQQELITEVAQAYSTAEEIVAAARELSSTTFGFVDLVAEEAVLAYQSERDGWIQRRNVARLARVTALLAAHGPADQDVEHALGYALATTHLGCVLWTRPEGDGPGLERRATAVADALGCRRPPLVVMADGASVWAWLPAPVSGPDAARTALPPGTFAAFGEPAEGAAGFRATHLQARHGQAVASAAHPDDRPSVTTPALLGPLALLALEPVAAAGWARSVLGGLARDDPDSARLRATVWSYLAAGSNVTAAAEELHLHRNTVQYRLAKAERVRGRSIGDDRLAVEVALLACRVLGSAVLEGSVTPLPSAART